MSMYAIKDTTLTALGDAVRNKVGVKYISVEEPTTAPIYSLNVNIKEIEPTIEGSVITYETPLIDFKTLLGEMYDSTKNLYFSYSYESNIENKYFRNFIWKNPDSTVYFDTTNIIHGLSYSGNLFTPFKSDTGLLRIATNKGLHEEWEFKFYLDIWACDENNKFIIPNKYTPLEMADVINGLEVPNIEPIVLTSNQPYGCAGDIASTYIGIYGNTISTEDIIEAQFMFSNYKNETIPFTINLSKYCTTLSSMFKSCINLKALPQVIGVEKNIPTSAYSENMSLQELFYNCQNLKEIPNDFFWKVVPNKEYWDKANELHSGVNIGSMFYNCYSLRELPDLCMFERTNLVYYYNPYGFGYCYSLNKIANLSIHGANAGWTSNVFSSRDFSNNSRLSNMTFAVNEDGTPKTANWKNQTIDLTGNVGWAIYNTHILNYNSGITADKEVKDDATYQALKNDADWFTTDVNYSRYNHTSAVNTINSLPDTSAYLAASGGTNTIKFKGSAGALTDGGAINTLTEEEIAVATARGWTVSLV